MVVRQRRVTRRAGAFFMVLLKRNEAAIPSPAGNVSPADRLHGPGEVRDGASADHSRHRLRRLCIKVQEGFQYDSPWVLLALARKTGVKGPLLARFGRRSCRPIKGADDADVF